MLCGSRGYKGRTTERDFLEEYKGENRSMILEEF